MFILLFCIGFFLLLFGIIALVTRAIHWGRFPLWETIATSLGLIIMVVVTWLTKVGVGKTWADLSDWLGITATNANQVQTLATIFGVLVALVGVFFIVHQLKMAERSLRQAARASLDVVRTQHNWKLFEHKVDPGLPGLPSRVPRNQEYWKWRIVHLDHLNLLHTQWIDYDSGAISSEEIEGWIDWAKKLILPVLLADLRDAETKLGTVDTQEIMKSNQTSSRLRAFLHMSVLHNWDLFPKNFVRWLRKEYEFYRLGVPEKR